MSHPERKYYRGIAATQAKLCFATISHKKVFFSASVLLGLEIRNVKRRQPLSFHPQLPLLIRQTS